jgi:hypothetical protein
MYVKQEADKRELYTNGCTYGCKLHLELFQSFMKKKLKYYGNL